MISSPAALFYVARQLLTWLKFCPVNRKARKLEKNLSEENQSIYKCTKYIQYIKRAPFSVVFLFSLAWEGIIFSQTEPAEAVEAPQCYEFSSDFVALPLLPRRRPLTSTAPSAGQNGTGVPSAPSTAIQGDNTDLCKLYATKKSKLYHYFKIVYVKVIFLHVDCCYFVF